MQHELDCLSRYLDKKGIDLIVLYQLSVKEIIKYLRLSPFQRKCFKYCTRVPQSGNSGVFALCLNIRRILQKG